MWRIFKWKKLGVTISGGAWYSLGFSGSASREMSQTTCKERVDIWTVNIQRSLNLQDPWQSLKTFAEIPNTRERQIKAWSGPYTIYQCRAFIVRWVSGTPGWISCQNLTRSCKIMKDLVRSCLMIILPRSWKILDKSCEILLKSCQDFPRFGMIWWDLGDLASSHMILQDLKRD